VVDTPLSTRNFTDLLGYSAGANSNVNNATALGKGGDQIAVNGAANTQNNFLQDGVSVVDMVGSNSFAIISEKYRARILTPSKNSNSRMYGNEAPNPPEVRTRRTNRSFGAGTRKTRFRICEQHRGNEVTQTTRSQLIRSLNGSWLFATGEQARHCLKLGRVFSAWPNS
jgi:hypothetical protein